MIFTMIIKPLCYNLPLSDKSPRTHDELQASVTKYLFSPNIPFSVSHSLLLSRAVLHRIIHHPQLCTCIVHPCDTLSLVTQPFKSKNMFPVLKKNTQETNE